MFFSFILLVVCLCLCGVNIVCFDRFIDVCILFFSRFFKIIFFFICLGVGWYVRCIIFNGEIEERKFEGILRCGICLIEK